MMKNTRPSHDTSTTQGKIIRFERKVYISTNLNQNKLFFLIFFSFTYVGYLKSANKYLSSTPGGGNNATATSRPRVIQWDPHMGTDQSTLSVVLEQAISDPNETIPPMKLVFGQLVVETNQQQQRAPTASPISSQPNLIWITLVAHVPRFSDTLVQTNNSIHQQVPLSICVYDSTNMDTATDHWNFGVFTYKKGAAEG